VDDILEKRRRPANSAGSFDVRGAVSSDFTMEESAPQPKITALILSYNSAPALRRCLTALEASQGREQLEIIVVDCGSADESPTFDREFPGITVLRLERNFGATRALNIGMRTAAAEYLLFLSPSVVVEPSTVMALAARLDADETTGAACPLLTDESGQPLTEYRRFPLLAAMMTLWRDPDSLPRVSIDPTADAVPVDYPGRKAIAARKYFIKAINWFDAHYGDYGWDLELAYQLARSRKKILIVPSVRATLTRRDPLPFDAAALATISADRANGIAVFLGKHFGFFTGLSFRIRAALSALGHFQFRELMSIASAEKIDGSQRTL
jgi:glycosyltransferase involved in cell wall biosynthesis